MDIKEYVAKVIDLENQKEKLQISLMEDIGNELLNKFKFLNPYRVEFRFSEQELKGVRLVNTSNLTILDIPVSSIYYTTGIHGTQLRKVLNDYMYKNYMVP